MAVGRSPGGIPMGGRLDGSLDDAHPEIKVRKAAVMTPRAVDELSLVFMGASISMEHHYQPERMRVLRPRREIVAKCDGQSV
jgi:hypothetical protein